jgi:multicomponent Na+:H+ antiporter subunit E
MTVFLLNVLLALIWLALTGEFTPVNLALGFAAGYLVLRAARRALPRTGYFGRVFQVISFLGFFLWELFKANIRVAYDIVTPRHHMKPGVVAIPLELTTDEEITVLANLITLTPGTLSLDVSADRRTLYVHAMYVDDLEAFRREIKDGFERRVMELMR